MLLKCKHIKKIYSYSVPEMLVVFIIAVIIVFFVSFFAGKLNNLEYKNISHGRYECWVETSTDGKVTYKEYRIENESGKLIGDKQTATIKSGEYCMFEPPKNAAYITLFAVGGGGAGAQLAGMPPHVDFETTEYVERYNSKEDDSDHLKWPEWLKRFYIADCTKNNETLDTEQISSSYSNIYYTEESICDAVSINTKMSYKYSVLKYRNGGSAGKTVSMVFPSFPAGVMLYIKPGKGGVVSSKTHTENAQNGEDTIVEIKYSSDNSHCFFSDDCTSDCCVLINARGGMGGRVKDANGNSIIMKEKIILTGGKPGDYGISNFWQVKGKDANFKSVLESYSGFSMFESKIADYGLGNGGRGANNFAPETDNIIKFYYQTKMSENDEWSSEKTNATGYADRSELKALNNVDDKSYEINCIPSSDGSSLECLQKGKVDYNSVCSNGEAAKEQNGTYVCPAHDGNGGGFVAVW